MVAGTVPTAVPQIAREPYSAAMTTDETRAVLDHHTKALLAQDLDAVMEDYDENSVFISNLGGVVTGLDALRAIFGAAGGISGFEETSVHVEGEAAYTTWKTAGVAFGTDTFVIRNGKVALQTVAMVFE
jgi:ketosteroid isomerase-like protein